MSSPERWRRILAIFDAALDALPDERPSLLDGWCAGDADLRREVEALLAADAASGDFLDAPAASYAAPFLSEVGLARPGYRAGAVVGRYRLVEEIGRGGMGTVWLAERADGAFDHRVALKLVRQSMDSEALLARFLRERQILARLAHPNIARLLDGGLSDDGAPYFVMEHVAGLPITEHCDRLALPIERRLELFVLVCRAVGYAHQNLVVHRDLKPSNVLVTDTGEVKLLDFGIARLVDDGRVAGGTLTRGATMMTPEYASPEQLAGEPVTTASDVYQLGLLLYELLSGRRAYEPDDRSPAALARMVLEAPPSAPSSAAGRASGIVPRDGRAEPIPPEAVAERRGTTLRRLRRRLRGDLDTIVLRALRREPERRYPSAVALAEEAECHLAGLPIRFGGDRFSYRSVKFVRRHRVGAVSVLAVLALVVGLTTYYTLQLRAERDLARSEAAKATEAAGVLAYAFEFWVPDQPTGRGVSPDRIVNDAARRAEQELRGQPQTLAATLSVLGDLHTRLGRWGAADSLLSRALELQERLGPGQASDRAATLARLGRLLSSRGDIEAGESLLRAAADQYVQLLGPRHRETLRVQRLLGETLHWTRKLPEAEEVFRAVYASMDAEEIETSPLALEVAARLGYVLYDQGRFADALAILRPTLQRQRSIVGDADASTLRTLRYLGSTLRDSGRLEEAEPMYREALQACRTLYGEDHIETGRAMLVLALLLHRREALAEAEALLRSTAVVYDRAFGPEHFESATIWSVLGENLLDQGQAAEAEPWLRAAHRLFRRSFPNGHPDEGDVLNRLAYILLVRGAPDADSVYRMAVEFDDGRNTEAPVFVTDGVHYLAWVRHRNGDLAGAEVRYRKALDVYARQLPVGHAYRASSSTGLGAVLLDRGRTLEAREHLRQGLAEWEAHRPLESARIAEARALYERSLVEPGG